MLSVLTTHMVICIAVPITGKVQDVVQLTSQSYGINADEQEGILKYLIAGGDLSLYGLSNAVTIVNCLHIFHKP